MKILHNIIRVITILATLIVFVTIAAVIFGFISPGFLLVLAVILPVNSLLILIGMALRKVINEEGVQHQTEQG